MRLQRFLYTIMAPAIAAIAWLALTCAPANALVIHESLGTFNELSGSSNSILITAAVDNSGGPSNGDVYIGDDVLQGQASITKFDANGVSTGIVITGSETPQGSFSLVSFTSFYNSGIAVDSSKSANAGDIYVADIENDVVDKFGESGQYLCQITGSNTPSVSECDGVAGSNTPAGSMSPTGVAVDSSGDLYVSDAEHDVIDEFGTAGEYLGQISEAHITLPSAIAFNSLGDMYVANAQVFKGGAINVIELNPKGEFVAEVDSDKSFALSVNSSNNAVFVSEGSPQVQIAEYDSAGTLFAPFGPEQRTYGLATNNSTGDIYATTQHLAYIFGPAVVVPSVITGPATVGPQTTKVTLSGEVEPDLSHGGGEVTSCQFEYGTSLSYGQAAPCTPAVPYSGTTSVSADVNLTPSTEYHYRLSATDSGGTSQGGTNHGEDHTLVTYGPPGIDSQSSSDVVSSDVMTPSAAIHAQINSFGFDTSCRVQYVDETDFNASGYENAKTLPCNPTDIGSGFGDQSVSVTLSELQIGTIYHYRFIATNSAGTSTGTDQTFATFGVKSFSLGSFDQNNQPYTQAGGHPYSFTTMFSLSTTNLTGGRPDSTDANPKDIRVELPPGLIGNPEATPKCVPYNVAHADCSGATQVGVLKIDTAADLQTESPIYNLVPPSGMAAQLGARFNGFVTAHIDAKIRTGGNYGVTADSLYLSADEGIIGATVTLWGVPADPSHDGERYCPATDEINESNIDCHEHGSLVPFFTNPTSCSSSRTSAIHVDSWQEPGTFVSTNFEMPQVTGCEKLDFSPKILVEPEGHSADSPTGLKVELHIPQNENPGGLAEANLKNARVTLPQGVTVNPATAKGLESCSVAQIELKGPEPAKCPEGSKVGSVEVDTPLVNHPLHGGVYVAAEHENPFGSLLALYIAVNDPKTGVVIKVAGEVTPDPATGQLTTTFRENPQLPFEDLQINFFGGNRAALATPTVCGTYTSETALTPWSAPESAAPVVLASPFQITSGPGGSACAAPGFAPSLSAGTSNNAAGAFSPFTTTLARNDGEQRLKTVSIQMPPGLEGILAGIPLCGEPQASEGTCSAASKIGHVTVTAGVGNDPVTLPEAGKPQDPVYLTGSYAGAPFGLSIVVPAEAGPFNLDENGKPIVVRARIEVDPHTAQVSVLSDPLPNILQGVPTDVRTVNVVIDRERFTFNATSCRALSVSGTVASVQGASAGVSSPYKAANCSELPYKPAFSPSVSSTFSRTKGLGMTLKISPPAKQANTAKVRLVFPKEIPTRLSTLKHACPAQTFESNPAECSPESVIGSALAHTPVLSNPLAGPIYLVSYGGAAFPDAEIVLQGEGIKLVMDGKTNIQKGITSSTFETVPDAPFTTFEAHLPAGPHSAFAAVIKGKRNGSLCGQNLNIGNIFVGQNGMQIKQNTKIGVTGCHKAKKAKGKEKKKK